MGVETATKRKLEMSLTPLADGGADLLYGGIGQSGNTEYHPLPHYPREFTQPPFAAAFGNGWEERDVVLPHHDKAISRVFGEILRSTGKNGQQRNVSSCSSHPVNDNTWAIAA
jgi:hypothetical protein